jgi:hypothetical protein
MSRSFPRLPMYTKRIGNVTTKQPENGRESMPCDEDWWMITRSVRYASCLALSIYSDLQEFCVLLHRFCDCDRTAPCRHDLFTNKRVPTIRVTSDISRRARPRTQFTCSSTAIGRICCKDCLRLHTTLHPIHKRSHDMPRSRRLRKILSSSAMAASRNHEEAIEFTYILATLHGVL